MEFHLIRNGKQEGPFTVEELAQQGITPESEVWAAGMSDWQQAGDVPELTAVLQRAEFEASQQAARAAENQVTTGQPYEPSGVQVPPPPAPRYGIPTQEPPKKKSGCTPWLIAALILAILFATMVFTCPDRSAHEKAIQEVTKQWVGDKVDENLNGITGMGGMMGDIINKIVAAYRYRRNEIMSGKIEMGEGEQLEGLDYFIDTETYNLFPLKPEYKNDSVKEVNGFSSYNLFKG